MDNIASQLWVVVSQGNLVGTGRGCRLSPCRLRGIWHVLWPLVMMQFSYAFLPRTTAKPSFFLRHPQMLLALLWLWRLPLCLGPAFILSILWLWSCAQCLSGASCW